MPRTAAPPPAAAPHTAAPHTAAPHTAAPHTAAPHTAAPRPAAPQAAAPQRAAPASQAGGEARVVLAFDFGHRRIGVACGDTVSRSAAPLGAVAAGPGGPRWEAIDALLREWQPALIVVGLPYNVDGSDSAMTRAARGFAAELEGRYGLQVVPVDERYSSRDAEARLKSARESGLRRRRVAKTDVDAAAACVILERWFTEQR
jgi:putative holliday junction resolvase